MPFLMLLAVQLAFFVALVGVVAFLLVLTSRSARLGRYRRGLFIGLCASPVGFIAPYLLLALIMWLCHGTWPTDGIPVIDTIARIFVGFLPIAGPCIGPVIVIIAAMFIYRRHQHVHAKA
jgi:hypothetical protein